ncbi:MAG: CbiQ family ECF transporter T component [Gallionella sp.]
MRFHPSSEILAWCMVVVMLQAIATDKLLLVSSLTLIGALVISGKKFILLLRRTRWIMLSLLLIFAFSTPGVELTSLMGNYGPTQEGLIDGLLQLTRVMAALAALAILLERLHRQKLISGLYTIFLPLRWLGMSRERLAVRLALTLYYAELTMLKGVTDWQSMLGGLFESKDEPLRKMELTLYRFGLSDAVLVLLAAMFVWMMMQ